MIERDTGSPHRTVRFCVTSNTELAKCRVLRQAAFSRDIRPPFDCIQEATLHDCLKTVRDDGADIITLDGGEVVTAQRWVPVVIAKRVHSFPVDGEQAIKQRCRMIARCVLQCRNNSIVSLTVFRLNCATWLLNLNVFWRLFFFVKTRTFEDNSASFSWQQYNIARSDPLDPLDWANLSLLVFLTWGRKHVCRLLNIFRILKQIIRWRK